MPEIPVTHYKVAWHRPLNQWNITLVTAQGEFVIDGLTAMEAHAVVELLRNERPIYWNPATEWMSTGSELVGEEEL
jgi:hypothetical protein